MQQGTTSSQTSASNTFRDIRACPRLTFYIKPPLPSRQSRTLARSNVGGASSPVARRAYPTEFDPMTDTKREAPASPEKRAAALEIVLRRKAQHAEKLCCRVH